MTYCQDKILLDFYLNSHTATYAISLEQYRISLVKYLFTADNRHQNHKEYELITVHDLQYSPLLSSNTYGWVNEMITTSAIKSLLFLSSFDTFTLCNIHIKNDSLSIQIEVWPLEFHVTHLYPAIKGVILSCESDDNMISYYTPNIISPWKKLDFHNDHMRISFVSTICFLPWIVVSIHNPDKSHLSLFHYEIDSHNDTIIIKHLSDIAFTITGDCIFYPIVHILSNEMMLYFASCIDSSLYLITSQFDCILIATFIYPLKALSWDNDSNSDCLLLCKSISGYSLFIGGFESLSIKFESISDFPFPSKDKMLRDIISLLATSLPSHIFTDFFTQCISLYGSITEICQIFEHYSFPQISISRIKLGLLLLKQESYLKSLSTSILDKLIDSDINSNSNKWNGPLPIQGNFLDRYPFINPDINKWCFSVLSSSYTGMIYDKICNDPFQSHVFGLFNMSFDFCRLFHSCISHQYHLFAYRLESFLNLYCPSSSIESLRSFPLHMVLPIYHQWWNMSRNPLIGSFDNWQKFISLFDRKDLEIKYSDQIGPDNKYRFAQDNRLYTVYHSLLDPSGITIANTNIVMIEDSIMLEEQQRVVMENLYKKLSQSFGFAIFMMDTINNDSDIIIESETIGSTLFTPLAINTSVKFATHTSSPEPNSFPTDWMDMPMYWNGLGQGLRRFKIGSSSYSLSTLLEHMNGMNQDIHDLLMHILTKNPHPWSSGLLLSLGLQGYFTKNLEDHVQLYYELLAIGSPWISNNLLLALAISNMGTMNRLITKLCCLHCPSMMVQDSSIDDHYIDETRTMEKQSDGYSFSYLKSSISPVLLPHPSMSLGAIASLGLLYCGTGHERTSMILLNELESIWSCTRSNTVIIPKTKDKKYQQPSNIESFCESFSPGSNRKSDEHRKSSNTYGSWSTESQGHTIALALGWIHLGKGKNPHDNNIPWTTRLLNWSSIRDSYNSKTLSLIPCLISLCLQYYKTRNTHILLHMKDQIQCSLNQNMPGEYIFYSTMCYYMALCPDEQKISLFDVISNDKESYTKIFISMLGLNQNDLVDWNAFDKDPLELADIDNHVASTFYEDEMHSEMEYSVFLQTIYLASAFVFYVGLKWAGSHHIGLYRYLSRLLRLIYEKTLSKPIPVNLFSLVKRQRISILMYFGDLILLSLCLIMSGSGHLPLLRVLHGLLKQDYQTKEILYYPLHNRNMTSLQLVHSCLGFLLSCQGTRSLDTKDNKRMASLFTSLLPFVYSFPVRIEPPGVFPQMNQSLWHLIPSLQHLQSISNTPNSDNGLFSGPGPLPFLQGLCILTWRHNERLLLVCQEDSEQFKFLNAKINVVDAIDDNREIIISTPCFIEQQSSIKNKKWIEWKSLNSSEISFSCPYKNTILPFHELFCMDPSSSSNYIRNLCISRTEHPSWIYREGCCNSSVNDCDVMRYYALAKNPAQRRKYPINSYHNHTCLLDNSCCDYWDALVQDASLNGILRYWKDELYFVHIMCYHPSLSSNHDPDKECLFGYLLWKKQKFCDYIIPDTLLLKYILQ